MNLADQMLQCSDCGDNFVFSAGEQELLAVRGARGMPKRCPSCRRPHVRSRLQDEGSVRA